MFSATKKNRILSHIKDTIFLHVMIRYFYMLRYWFNDPMKKPRKIFYLINQIQCFIIRISVAVCWFQFVCRTFIFCEQNELFWEQNQIKTCQMADPHFRVYVGVMKYSRQNNTWAFGDTDLYLSVQFRAPMSYSLFNLRKDTNLKCPKFSRSKPLFIISYLLVTWWLLTKSKQKKKLIKLIVYQNNRMFGVLENGIGDFYVCFIFIITGCWSLGPRSVQNRNRKDDFCHARDCHR